MPHVFRPHVFKPQSRMSLSRMSLSRMSFLPKSFDRRSMAVAVAGFSAFVNLYSPQALLPELAQ
jgi:hypothetical protein